MTTQITAETITKSPSVWQQFKAWLTAFEQALDYDPQENTDANIRYLKAEVERLNARLDATESRDQGQDRAA